MQAEVTQPGYVVWELANRQNEDRTRNKENEGRMMIIFVELWYSGSVFRFNVLRGELKFAIQVRCAARRIKKIV